MKYRSLEGEEVQPSQAGSQGYALYQLKTGVLLACNSIISAIPKQCTTPGVRGDFSKIEGSLNGIYKSTGPRGTLEGKCNQSLNIMFFIPMKVFLTV